MTSHYDATQELLEFIETKRQALYAEYERPEPSQHVIGHLHNEIRTDLKVADVRANLAVAAALDDVFGVLDSGLDSLASEVRRCAQ